MSSGKEIFDCKKICRKYLLTRNDVGPNLQFPVRSDLIGSIYFTNGVFCTDDILPCHHTCNDVEQHEGIEKTMVGAFAADYAAVYGSCLPVRLEREYNQ